jgi:predicted NAD/FAD-binding protein
MHKNISGQKVAVIGSGISGLSAAWFIGQDNEVTLFESEARLGGHTHTLDVQEDGRSFPVDTGFIVFNPKNYPHLVKMFAHLGVESYKTDMSLAVSLNGGGFEYSGSDTLGFFGQFSNWFSPRHWWLLREILRFNKKAKFALANQREILSRITMQDFLALNRFGEDVAQRYVLPMAGAIWSCPKDAILNFNALSMLRFYENHGLLNIHDRPQWYTVRNGARTYIDKILSRANFQVKLSEAVLSVTPGPKGASVKTRLGEYDFDHVVFACHSDQAHRMIEREEYAVLGQLPYQPNTAYLHRDASWLPKREALWASWNYVQKSEEVQTQEPITVTYWMNGLQDLPTQRPVNVTLNPAGGEEPGECLAKIEYAHPLFDENTVRVQQAIEVMQGRHNLWFCGAYLGSGFHEDGLRSSVHLASLWGIKLPWEA